MSTTKTVRAYKYLKRGKPADVLQLDDRHQVPKPGNDEVLIKVKAVGLNPVDWKIMNYLPSFIAKHPAIAGCDYSGTVLESTSADFAAGDEVFGIVHSTLKVSKGLGSLAEEIVAPKTSCAKRPEHVEAIPAAGLPLVGLTAIVLSREVEWALKKKDAPKVLVSGGSSSVGLQLVPVLKHKGCFVAATCSAAKAEMVKARGADVTFDCELFVEVGSSQFPCHR
ncbi:hypothetical protein L7F22_051390 [Adiantum nelumboides]|nr:hypothetical protein [Adiantum nelumboides]